jgi:hypothetical protein
MNAIVVLQNTFDSSTENISNHYTTFLTKATSNGSLPLIYIGEILLAAAARVLSMVPPIAGPPQRV